MPVGSVTVTSGKGDPAWLRSTVPVSWPAASSLFAAAEFSCCCASSALCLSQAATDKAMAQVSDSKGKRGIESSNQMWGGRFAEGPSAIMREINASIPFDKALWRQDIAASKAHVAMLGACGIVSAEDALAIEQGLDQVAAEYEAQRRARGLGPRRHPHDHREPAGRTDRSGGREAAHRAQPQRPGGDRFPPVGARCDRPGRCRARGAAKGAGHPRGRACRCRSCPASPTCRRRSR